MAMQEKMNGRGCGGGFWSIGNPRLVVVAMGCGTMGSEEDISNYQAH